MARNNKQSQDTSPFSFSSDNTEVPGRDDGSAKTAGKGVVNNRNFGFKKPNSSTTERESQSVFGTDKPVDSTGPEYGYERSLLGHRNEVSAYTAQMDARYAMDPRKRSMIIMFLVVLVLIPTLAITPTGWLTEDGLSHGPAYWVDLLQSNLSALSNIISGIQDGNGLSILIWQTLTLAFVGAALALNGAVYQGALKNALASPSTLGVMSGGTLGAVIYTLLFGVPEASDSLVTVTRASEIQAELSGMSTFDYVIATQGRAFCAIAGSFCVVGLVLLIAFIAGRGKVSKSALVIAGQVFASVITGTISVIRYYLTYNGTDEQISAIRNIMNGSITNIMGPLEFALVAIPVTIGIIIIMRLRFKLNLLAFNDEEAKSMGISTNFTRNLMVGTCTVLTAVVVAFCGSVGFVGFLIPHLTRKIVGPDFRYLIPASMFMGAIYLLIAHYVMSLGNFFSGSLGSVTTLIGVVFFLVTIIQQRRVGNADWI